MEILPSEQEHTEAKSLRDIPEKSVHISIESSTIQISNTSPTIENSHASPAVDIIHGSSSMSNNFEEKISSIPTTERSITISHLQESSNIPSFLGDLCVPPSIPPPLPPSS